MSLSVYLVVVITVMLTCGKYIFDLPFTRETPFYEEVTLRPTNKTVLYTMAFNALFLTLLTNLTMLKVSSSYTKYDFDTKGNKIELLK